MLGTRSRAHHDFPHNFRCYLRPTMLSTTTQTASYFNRVVEEEHVKFKRNCEIWNKILEDGSAPVAVHGDILCTIGQANLFQNKRFKQFKDLIELHQDESAEKKATESDLKGFWEMIHYQVEDVHNRFHSLEEMKLRNWAKEEKPEVEKLQTSFSKNAKTKSKPIPENKSTANKVVPSNFKSFRQKLKKNKLEKTNE